MTDVPYEEVTENPWFSISMFGAMFSVLYILSLASGGGAVNTIYFYVIFLLVVLVFGSQQTDFNQITKVMGFKEPYSGFNIMMAVMGIGVAGLLYKVAYQPAAALVSGTEYMSLVRPFYLPQSVNFPGVGLLALTGVGGVLYYLWVGITEEEYKNFIFKNMTNWFTKKGLSMNYAAVISFVISLLMWGSLHYMAWDGLTIGSILFSVFWGFAFWATYFVPDVIGVLTPDDPVEWTGVMLAGAWSSHAVWDILVTQGPPLPGHQFTVLSLIFVIVPPIAMVLIRRHENDKLASIPIRKI